MGYPRRVTGYRLLALLALVACGDDLDGDTRQGGDTTVDDRSREAYRHPAANLDDAQRLRHQAGRSPFDFVWEVPKLGPLFNNSACLGCHGKNGRGLSQIGDGPVSQALIRVSQSDGEPGDPAGGPSPLPGYGTQLQDHATVGLAEVRVTLTWLESVVAYDDGDTVAMREPRLEVRTPMGELLPANTRYSYRTAPPLIGMGLLEAIPDATLEALADPDDADGDGISGRPNRVWDPLTNAEGLGRFGWKANQAGVEQQVSGAFAGDLGITSALHPDQNCPPVQTECAAALTGGEPEADADTIRQVTYYARLLAVPARRDFQVDDVLRGKRLFHDAGCASCHVPKYTTGDVDGLPELSQQTIFPYSDMLLHDMGDELADHRPDYLADGNEWRTPPLWGLGLVKTVNGHTNFLHDGRARDTSEAILWHGGEAAAARDVYKAMTADERAALLRFVESL